MKINSNNLQKYEKLLHKLPLGIILINMQNKIVSSNQTAERYFNAKATHLIGKDIHEFLENPSTEEVKQLHQQVDKKELLKGTNRKLVTSYSPFLNHHNTLQGVLMLLEPLEKFNQRVSNITESDFYFEIVQELLQTQKNAFRIVMENKDELLSSKQWKAEFDQYNTHIQDWVNQLVYQTIRSRRKRTDSYQPDASLDTIDVFTKPLQKNGKLIGCVQYVTKHENNALKQELDTAKKMIRNLEKTYHLEDIIGETPEINIAREQARLYADMDTPVLIRGEQGTGKLMLARAIHMTSHRKYLPFLKVNSSDLIESNLEELFLKISKKIKNGTVYVNFNQKLTLDYQNKLLAFINEQSTIRFIYGISHTPVISEWSPALYDLLQKYQIILPPLKERLSDLPLLVEAFKIYFNQEYDKQMITVENDVIDYWQKLNWSGNITELKLEVERIILEASSFTSSISLEQLHNKKFIDVSDDENQLSLQQAIDLFEKKYIVKALEQQNFNKTKTAKMLGVSVRNLYYKMEKYKIERGAI
ncbi:sigma 54-interacting transcriptional regulator [Gracilibacillus kekensis]|uniref:PAS domain S-box-containing protein n=1 Tax=Gracilibacillus kekensis TaxID=1027249 RepID=A0A1M7P7Q2_9BACI|nr:sigma 54-interacting transcriptional regulator [Gracilibacillus kekensis]SHN12749.1 PAS domain S-box-containing protein [Gracilibacillus kekensis]